MKVDLRPVYQDNIPTGLYKDFCVVSYPGEVAWLTRISFSLWLPHTSKYKNNQKCWHVPHVLTSASSLSSSLTACWLEEEDRVSYWQRLYGAWQGEPQPVQLCGLEKEKVTEKKKKMQMVQSGWGDRSLNLLLQWTLTIIIFNPATDKWMDTAPQDICQGSCDPVDCMPIEKRILSMFLRASERVGLQWTDKEDTQMFRLLFFFLMESKNIYFQT